MPAKARWQFQVACQVIGISLYYPAVRVCNAYESSCIVIGIAVAFTIILCSIISIRQYLFQDVAVSVQKISFTAPIREMGSDTSAGLIIIKGDTFTVPCHRVIGTGMYGL